MLNSPGTGFALGDNSVEALGKLWGERHFPTRTFGTAERTRTLALLHAMADPMTASAADPDATPAQTEHLRLPHLMELAQHLSASWAGEAGWETHMLVKAIGASKAQSNYVQPLGLPKE